MKPTNWKTTFTAVLEAVVWVLTVLSILPYDSGMQVIGELFGQETRDTLFKVGMASGFILRIISGKVAADANPTVRPKVDAKNLMLMVALVAVLGMGASVLAGCAARGWDVGLQGRHESGVEIGFRYNPELRR